MKVNIPRPATWFGPYHLVDVLLPFLSEQCREKIADQLPAWPFQAVFNIKSWFKRPSIKIEDHDVWSMDHTLAPIILPMLRKIRESKWGIPSAFVVEGDGEFLGEWEADKAVPELYGQSTKAWKETLDKMIWAFETMCDPDGHESYYYDMMTQEEIDQELASNPDSVWHKLGHPGIKYNPEKAQAFRERVDEGLTLFGTHFQSLWT